MEVPQKEKKSTWGNYRRPYGYFSVFPRWDDRGVSSKVKGEMLRDVMRYTEFLKRRIEKNDYLHKRHVDEVKEKMWERVADWREKVTAAKKERSEEIQNLKAQVREEKRNVKDLDAKVKSLEAKLGDLKDDLFKHKGYLKRREIVIDKLRKELQKIKRRKPQVVKVEVPTKNSLKVEKLFHKRALRGREVDLIDFSSKLDYILREKEISMTEFLVLQNTAMVDKVEVSDLLVGTRRDLKSLTAKGLLQEDSLSFKALRKYYFVTSKGRDLINNITNYISYGVNPYTKVTPTKVWEE